MELAARRDSWHPSACYDSEVAISASSVIITGMERQRIIRWLRVAVSAVCLTVSVLLLIRVLWIQASFRTDWSDILGVYVRVIDSVSPKIEIGEAEFQASRSYLGFYSSHVRTKTYLCIPYWFLALGFAAFAYVSCPPLGQIRWRFSLRTLLIVTTLVAVVLGLVVWMTG